VPDLFVELEVAGERASCRRFAKNDDAAVFHGAGALEDLAYGGRDSREHMGDGSGQSFFECFPYVCPEPVLVKCSFLDMNGSKRQNQNQ